MKLLFKSIIYAIIYFGDNMNIKRIIVGELEENCYIITKDHKTIIIDPGDEINKIKKEIEEEVIGIIITHYHFDHTGALNDILKIYDVPVIDINNQNILDPFQYKIIENPGHTKDSISIYFKEEKIIFCGDFIFAGTIGRTDLPTGNMDEMKESIKKILTYDENITLYPGHYESTTIKSEKNNLEMILNYY